MKTVYHLIIAAALTVTSFQTASAQTVYHLNKDHQWETSSIDGFVRIKSIDTAGSYAWTAGVASSNKFLYAFSFYNGEHWSVPEYLTKIENFDFGVYPAYPMTGEAPMAWELGEGKNFNLYLNYFDGSKWIAYDDKYSVDESDIRFSIPNGQAVSSSGNLWLVRSGQAQRDIIIINSKDPFNPKIVALPKDTITVGRIIGDTDGYPYMYILLAPRQTSFPTPKSDLATLIRYDRDGNSVVIKDNIQINQDSSQPENIPAIRIYQNNIFLLQWPDINIFSNDAGKTWIENPPIQNYPEEILGHNVCYMDNGKTSLNCYDALNANSPITSFPIENAEYQDVRNTPTGVWYQESNLDHEKIVHYNLDTSDVTDTGVTPLMHYIEYVRAISDNKLVGCGLDENYHPVAIYYNGKNWLMQNIGNGPCALSDGDGYRDSENVWAYDLGVTPPSVKMSHVNKHRIKH